MKQKGVVYCLSKPQCEQIAEQLGCAHYHARVDD
jgi:superfamily II DNA helicase RecQ